MEGWACPQDITIGDDPFATFELPRDDTIVTLTLSLSGLCLLNGTSGQMGSAPLHVATFSMKGASGTVTFREGTPEPVVSVSVALVGLAPGSYTWAIHEKPMIYGQKPSCDPALVGGVYAHGGDLTAVHNISEVPSSGNWSANFIDQVITLSGPKSITGRTLVLQEESSQRKYCAQIANSLGVVTAVASFDEPFAGTVTFRQERNQPQSQTSIFIDLYDVTGSIVQTKYTWRVSSNSGYSNDMDHEALCDKTSSDFYNPTGLKTMTCGREDLMSCPIGYLVGKFDDVTVEPIPSLMTYYFIDTNLPMSSEHSVIGKSLVFSNAAGNPIACSPIIELKPKSVKALFSVNGVSGTAVFSQDSPYDITKIQIDLKNLRGLAGGYHVHALPPPPRTYASDQPASLQNVGGHYNPYDIGSSPPVGTGTNDQYEVGDLSGKFGLLTGYNDFNGTYYDWNLPLFGTNSIIGRSLVIHKMEGDRWVYAAIGYPTQQKTVKAVFTAPTVGKIVMRQNIDDPYADTSIYIEMAFADGSATTTNHNWHVHTLATGNDHIASNGRCVGCAGHFNPFGVELGENYDQCSPAFPQRCELGDLGKKHGRLTITNRMNLGMGKFFFTDIWLPLSGVHSVTGRSIVINAADEGSARISCADLLQIPPTESTAVLWSHGPVSGDITFKQDSDFDPVLIHIHVAGLNNIASGWHVHVLPIDKDMNSAPCSSVSVLGHYNPFRIVGSPPNGTLDMYEMGDLSGKFETFSGVPDVMDHVYKDTNLALAGPRSIIGRSLVIHKSADGSRWVCASIERKTHEDDFIIRARTDITTTDFTGYVILVSNQDRVGNEITIYFFYLTQPEEIFKVVLIIRVGLPIHFVRICEI